MNEYRQIPKKNFGRILLHSMLIPFSLVVVVAILVMWTLTPSSLWDFEFLLTSWPIFILISIMVVLCWAAETVYLRKPIGKWRLIELLIIESIIAAFLSFNMFFATLIIGAIGNLIRFFYLKSKLNCTSLNSVDRFYNNSFSQSCVW